MIFCTRTVPKHCKVLLIFVVNTEPNMHNQKIFVHSALVLHNQNYSNPIQMFVDLNQDHL